MTLLAWIVAAPLVGALAVALLGRSPNARDTASLIAAVVTFALVASLAPAVLEGARPGLDLITVMPGVPFALAVEPLGMLFALVASFLWIVASLYSIGYMRGNQEKDQTRFFVCFALAIGFTLGLALSANLFTLFLFYEVLTLSTYPLVTHKGDDKAVKAGRVYLGILMSTSIGLLLIGILWVLSLTGHLDFRPGGILGGSVEGPVVGVLLLLFMYGIGKAALMPVHPWLPAAMVAPTPVSALLHAVAVVKAGVFTVVKVIALVFGLDLLTQPGSGTGWLVYASGATVVIASVIALRQDNLKSRLAYSTVSQLSYVIMAAALFTPLGIIAAALHIAAHAFGKITLFFAAGAIYTASKKDKISQLDGIGRRMPWTMTAFAIGALSMIGVPPTAGFVSKWFLLQGAWTAQAWGVLAVLVASTLLNAAYFLPIVHAAFLKPETVPSARYPDHGEAPKAMVVALGVTALGTVVLFFLPGLALDLARDLIQVPADGGSLFAGPVFGPMAAPPGGSLP